jgi:beta-phosphoglucomutase family hydrolase
MNGVKKTVPSESPLVSDLSPLPAAVIFDMDGTLVATTEADFLAWQRLFHELGHELTYAKYFPLLGRKSQDVVHDVLKLKGNEADKAMQRKMDHFEQIVSEKGIEVLPHAEAFLSELSRLKIPIALATSSRKMKMKLVMRESGLEKYFSSFVTGEEVKNGKPAPDIFLLAAKRLDVDPSRCLVLEDATNGVRAAKAAGMTCVAIASTHGESDLMEADLVIHAFSELSMDRIAVCFSKAGTDLL